MKQMKTPRETVKFCFRNKTQNKPQPRKSGAQAVLQGENAQFPAAIAAVFVIVHNFLPFFTHCMLMIDKENSICLYCFHSQDKPRRFCVPGGGALCA